MKQYKTNMMKTIKEKDNLQDKSEELNAYIKSLTNNQVYNMFNSFKPNAL